LNEKARHSVEKGLIFTFEVSNSRRLLDRSLHEFNALKLEARHASERA